MTWDAQTIATVIGAGGLASFGKPLLQYVTGRDLRRNRDITNLESRLEKESLIVRSLLEAQIAELKGQISVLRSQNSDQQKMINELSAEIVRLRCSPESRSAQVALAG